MLLALLLAAVAPLWSAQPAQVGEIVFEGAPAESVRSLVAVQVGAPLDARDVRDAVRALHGSARFSRVAAFAEPMADGRVRLVFVLTGIQKLLAVTFSGRKALADSILHQTANLQVNAEFQPELVEPAVEAIRGAYYRIGYRNAQVAQSRTTTPDGIALDFRIDEGPPTRIAEVVFAGDPGLTNDELEAALKLGQGDVLNMTLLDEGVRGVRDRYRKAGRLRARVDPPRVEEIAADQARVIVPVEAGPLVRFHIRGNRSFSDQVLSSRLGADSDEPLDAQAAQEMAGRLRRFYVAAGFLRVKVAEREMIARDGAEELVFTVDEGQPVRVEKVVFTGVKRIPEGQLGERLVLILRDNIPRDPAGGADPAMIEQTGVMGRLPDPQPERMKIDPETVFDPVLYARALKQFEDLYKSQGFLSARAGPPRLEPVGGDPDRLTVTIPVREGEQTIVSRVVVEGGADVPAKEIDSAIVLRAGQPFSYLHAEEGRSALTSIFTRRGHFYARVEDEENFEESAEGATEGKVEVRYRIQPGPVVKVGYVEVVGQRRTVEGLILDLVGLKPGDVLTPEVMDRGQQALLRTGLFFSATLTPRNPEVSESEKTVQVQLRERPTRDFQASMGFSLNDGPRVSAQWTQANILGRNLTFSAYGRANFPIGRFPTVVDDPFDPLTGKGCVGTLAEPCARSIQYPDDPIERVIDIGLSGPRLWPLTDAVRAGIDLIHQRALQPSYQLTKYSAQLSAELTRRRPFGAGLAYEFGYQNLGFLGTQSLEEVEARVDVALHRAPEGTMFFGSLRPTMYLDLRDDVARPRSGVFFQVGGDFLRSFNGSQTVNGTVYVNLLRLQGLAAGYVPLPGQSSIVLSVRGGRIFQLDPNSKDPLDRRFFLGGATTLRGFHEEALQPQDLVDGFHKQVRACLATLGDLACTRAVQLLQSGGTSDGGDQFLAMSAELRVPFTPNFEVAIFYDAGNLWLRPTNLFGRDSVTGNLNLVLRDAVGAGLRWLTPIGRVAIDIGVNRNPDVLLGEPKWGPYFSIDAL